MSKQYILDFLRDLTQNNSKEWMDENRNRYHTAKQIWLDEIEQILKRLAKHDPMFETIEAKDALRRINNNRMFHPDKPVYKDRFVCSPINDLAKPAFYISVSPSGSFIGGGLHRPDKELLDRLRAAIDYDGEQLKEIIQADTFQGLFGGLSEDEHMLKTSPRGYSKDHRHIDLLRRKTFTGMKSFSEAEFVSDTFVDMVEESFLGLKSFNEYLGKSVQEL